MMKFRAIILVTLIYLTAAAQPVPPRILALVTKPRTNTFASFIWNPVTNVQVQSYRLYWGWQPNLYTNSTTSTSTNASVTNLTRNVVYHFAVSAVSDMGIEGSMSADVSNAPWTNTVTRVWAQTSGVITGPWSDIPGSMIFVQTNTSPAIQLFRLVAQTTNAP